MPLVAEGPGAPRDSSEPALSQRKRPKGAFSALPYQDDFETPGISPRNASPRKHKRHMPNLRK